MEIKSPVTNSTNVTLVRKLSIKHIIELYARLGLDVNPSFANVADVGIYHCNDSQLNFYSPAVVAGNNEFYEALERVYSNYYANWKWEHEMVLKFVKKDMKVLEIGCAHGSFLKRLQIEGIESVIGLELNNNAVLKATQNGLDVRNELVESHKLTHLLNYDLICSFQVVEHIAYLKDFLVDSLACLKVGGLYSISVPNNDCYLYRNDPDHTLNLPPHHMGLWNEDALIKLADLFNLEVVSVFKEPANTSNFGSYYEVFLRNTLHLNTAMLKFVYVSTRPFVKLLMKVFPPKYGACITVIYRKK